MVKRLVCIVSIKSRLPKTELSIATVARLIEGRRVLWWSLIDYGMLPRWQIYPRETTDSDTHKSCFLSFEDFYMSSVFYL